MVVLLMSYGADASLFDGEGELGNIKKIHLPFPGKKYEKL